MHFGFQTDDKISAKAAMVIYSIYRSRDKRRGPSGTDMWGQIERFARSSAKRSSDVGEFVNAFKRKMACDTISPRYTDTGEVPKANEYGEILVIDGKRNFMLSVIDGSPEEQDAIVETIYKKTAWIILLVRDRLETEKYQAIEEEGDNE